MKLNEIINSFSWTFAKSYTNTNPHEYIVRTKCGNVENFDFLCECIKKNGTVQYFFNNENLYLEVGDYTYWVMGQVINRRWNDMYVVDKFKKIRKVDNWKELLQDGRVLYK